MTLSYSHTDEYLACYLRTFIWQWSEMDTEIQMSSRRWENMSKEVRTIRVAPNTMTVELIYWELTMASMTGTE